MNLAGTSVECVKTQTMMAEAGANLPGNERILLGDVVSNQQHGWCIVDVRHGGERIFRARTEGGGETRVVRGAMVVEIVGAESDAREAIEEIIFFVGRVIRTDYADGGRPMIFVDLFQSARDFLEHILPTGGFQFAIATDERLANSVGMMCEIESEAALGAEKFAVKAGMVAIVGA